MILQPKIYLLLVIFMILGCTAPMTSSSPTITATSAPMPTDTELATSTIAPTLTATTALAPTLTATSTAAPSSTEPLATLPTATIHLLDTVTPTEEAALRRILLVSATAGYYHSSIPTAQAVIEQLAQESGHFEVELIDSLEGLEGLSAESLASYDLLFFANTSGELPLDDAQKQAMLDFVGSGKGFMGTHSATDTFYEWAAYGELIGAYFDSHPWVQDATIDVEDAAHPANGSLPTSYNLLEEYYTFRQNPRPHVHVLQSLNAGSVNTAGDYPLVWCKSYGEGRVYYNALGHFDETWLDPRFQSQLLGAMQWATGLNDVPCPVSKALYLPLIARY